MDKPCLACGHVGSARWATASDEEYVTTDESFEYLKCDACHALFIDPIPKDRLDQIYPSNYYSFDEKLTNSFVFKIKDRLDQLFFKRFISDLTSGNLNVLDVGGGNGWQLDSLRKVDDRIRRTVIVDLDENAGQTARTLGHEYFCGRFEEYESDELFEVVLMLNLIEHVDNPGQLLRKAASMLAPGGIVIVKTPNIDSLDARIFRHRNWGGYHCPRHWVLFNRQNFTSLVQASGLSVKHFKYTQGAPFWTTSILFALGRNNWIEISPERPVPKHPLFPLLNMGFACLDLVRSKLAKTSQMIVVLEKT